MRSFHMHVFGVSRTYHDFFIGFGYSLSIYMLLQAVLLWLLVSWMFVFPVPTAFFAAVAICLLVSYVQALKSH